MEFTNVLPIDDYTIEGLKELLKKLGMTDTGNKEKLYDRFQRAKAKPETPGNNLLHYYIQKKKYLAGQVGCSNILFSVSFLRANKLEYLFIVY